MGASMRVTGDKKAALRVELMSKRASNVTPMAWRGVGRYIADAERRQFTSEGKYMGTPWRPLKPEYRLWKIRQGYMRKIMARTGSLRRKFTSRPMDVERYTHNTGTYGVNDRLAKWHHYGTRRNGKQVNPPRRLMKVTPFMRRDIRDILARYVTRGRV